MVNSLFEGAFRSVLICQQCGNKRAQTESFMSISLPLSKEVHRLMADGTGKSSPGHHKLSVERCLRHFTMPETLVDPVDCPSCGKKTLTKKQHVISKLPRVLCLHLKRFDAAHNKKIEDFVSFPEKNLNMGPYLPHWYVVASQSRRIIVVFRSALLFVLNLSRCFLCTGARFHECLLTRLH